MGNILETIAESTRQRVSISKEKLPQNKLMDMAFEKAESSKAFLFEESIRSKDIAFICECKKASPSKGLIAPDFDYLNIAKDYEAAGAAAISVLTEPEWFKGDIRYLKEIASEVKTPCLRKDFTVDEYMIYEARANGASAVLLICSILTSSELERYLRLSEELGLSALVEAHDREEVTMALGCGARIVGVNNRNLKDFTVDPLNCLRLREYIPEDVIFVAESGIKSKEDIRNLYDNKVNAVLMGESLMRSPDKKAFIEGLRELL